MTENVLQQDRMARLQFRREQTERSDNRKIHIVPHRYKFRSGTLINLRNSRFVAGIEFLDPGVQAYAFTFG